LPYGPGRCKRVTSGSWWWPVRRQAVSTMSDKTEPKKDKKLSREERVKAALRANLKRRKNKARAQKKAQLDPENCGN